MNDMGHGVVLIPQLFGNQNDSEYLARFNFDNVFILPERFNSSLQQTVIKKLYALIGLRYHSNIFAANVGTPFVAVSYEHKMDGFLKHTLMENYSLKIENLNSKSILEKFKLVQQDYDLIKSYLMEMHSTWQVNARNVMNFAEPKSF